VFIRGNANATYRYTGEGAVVAEHNRDVDEHDEITDEDCQHVTSALTVQLILNGPLHSTQPARRSLSVEPYEKKPFNAITGALVNAIHILTQICNTYAVEMLSIALNYTETKTERRKGIMSTELTQDLKQVFFRHTTMRLLTIPSLQSRYHLTTLDIPAGTTASPVKARNCSGPLHHPL